MQSAASGNPLSGVDPGLNDLIVRGSRNKFRADEWFKDTGDAHVARDINPRTAAYVRLPTGQLQLVTGTGRQKGWSYESAAGRPRG